MFGPQRKRRKDAGTSKKTVPDEVITFRLDPAVPAEQQALEIFRHYKSQFDENGVEYSTRQIMMWALHALAGIDLPSSGSGGSSNREDLSESFWDLYEKMSDVVEQLQSMGVQKVEKSSRTRKRIDDETAQYIRNMGSGYPDADN